VRQLLCCLLLVAEIAGTAAASELSDRRAAVWRAFEFIYATASGETAFSDHGDDFLWCFYSIANTSSDRGLRTKALGAGRTLARKWRQAHPRVPKDADASDVAHLVMGAYAADKLGFRDAGYEAELRRAARQFSARDYLGFDAPHEPPDPNDPDRYNTWYEALTYTFFGDAYGIRLGARYCDVIQWRSRMQPYDAQDDSLEFDIFYAVTHVVYTLNGYGARRVERSLLPQETAFLKAKMSRSIVQGDPEMVGESLDCLKALDLENDPLVRQGTEYLLTTQRPDGTWAGDADDIYTAYHSAWTGLDGLRDYRFHGKVKRIPSR
jgi:hypothetical protein